MSIIHYWSDSGFGFLRNTQRMLTIMIETARNHGFVLIPCDALQMMITRREKTGGNDKVNKV